MDQMEDKLNTILNNPELMGQILSMANSLGQSAAKPEPTQTPELPNFDPALLSKLPMLAGHGQVDGNQKALLTALNPYLSQHKLNKLERAMRAARMARMASSFLGQGGLSLLTGR